MLICFILLIGHDTLDVQISTNRIIYYGIPSACIVFLMLCLEDIIGNNKPIRLLILLGDISYVIYLLHFFGVFILPYIEVRSNNTALEIIKLMMAILFVIITSFLVHKYFDMPLRRFLTRHLIQVKNEK
jgi:peptidoglycan/LPS O-acetylase OafA/YrhL